MPTWVEGLVNIPRIDQRWWMFTLDSWEDFWLDVEGQDKNGKTIIDPFTWHLNLKDTSFSLERPISYQKDLGTQLWNRYMYEIKDRKVTGEWFLYNLCKKYNAANPQNKIKTVILHQSTQKMNGFAPRGKISNKVINQWTCND